MSLTIVNDGGVLRAKGVVDGKRVNRSLHLPPSCKAEAKVAVKKIEESLTKPKIDGGSFSEVALAYLKWKEMEGKNTLSPDYKYRIPRIIAKVGKVKPHEIDVSAYALKQAGRLTAGSVKKELNMLKAILRFGVDHGMVESMPKFPKIKVDDARDVSFTPSQVKSFLELVREHWPEHELLATILVDAGLRVGEACALTSYDLEGGLVVVKKKMQGKAKTRSIPQSARLKALLATMTLPVGRVFKMTPNTASKVMKRVMDDVCKRMGVEPMRVHDLRHTFARQCGEAGVDLGELQHLMGHSQVTVTTRYRGFIKSRATSVIDKFGM